MNCPKCKAEMPNDALFCTECGTQIEGASDESKESGDAQVQEDVKVNEEVKTDDSKPEGDRAEESKKEIKEEVKEEIKEESKEEIKEEVKEDVKEEAKEDVKEEEEKKPQEPVAPEPPEEATPASVATAAAVPAGPTPEELKRQKQEAKRQKKEAKKRLKQESKAKIAELPKEYKPLSTAKMFGFILLTAIPVVGFIALLIFAFACKNKNIKSVARAILVYMLIFFIITVVFTVVSLIVLGSLFTDIMGDLTYANSVEEILYILDDLINAY